MSLPSTPPMPPLSVLLPYMYSGYILALCIYKYIQESKKQTEYINTISSTLYFVMNRNFPSTPSTDEGPSISPVHHNILIRHCEDCGETFAEKLPHNMYLVDYSIACISAEVGDHIASFTYAPNRSL